MAKYVTFICVFFFHFSAVFFFCSLDWNSSNDVCGTYIRSSDFRWSWCCAISSKNQTICWGFSCNFSWFIKIWLLVDLLFSVFVFFYRLAFQAYRQIIYFNFLSEHTFLSFLWYYIYIYTNIFVYSIYTHENNRLYRYFFVFVLLFINGLSKVWGRNEENCNVR